MKQGQTCGDFCIKKDFFAQRAGILFLRVNHELDDFVRRQVIIYAAVLGQFLKPRIYALLVFLDIVALAGNAQDFIGQILVFWFLGAVLQSCVYIVAVMGDIF